MHIFSVIVLTVCFFILLLTLFSLANDDFVLFRKHITIERVFNVAFLVAMVALFSARLFYVVFHFSPGFLNPLVFFLFPYFPGLSLAGGIIGGICNLVFLARSKLLPMARFFDLFALSFFCAFPFGLFLNLLFTRKTTGSFMVGGGVIVALILFIVCLKLFQKEKLKEGSTGFLSLVSVSFIAFATGFIGKTERVFFFLNKDDFLLLGIFVTSLIFLIRQEKKGIENFFQRARSRFR